MVASQEVVITGLGIFSPIGIGHDAFWQSLCQGRSGVGPISLFDASALPVRIGSEVRDFDAKQYVSPRKSLKVMSREIQLAFGAAQAAYRHAGLTPEAVDPDRIGVVFGSDMIYCEPLELIDAYRKCIVDGQFDFARWGQNALAEMFPLWLLKYLPNMPACHIAIALDARGPSNSITLEDASSLMAVAEAAHLIERGQADVIISGGTGSRIHPTSFPFRHWPRVSHRNDAPQRASRPFDADRDGTVFGEGAAALVLESRRHAEARRAPILARVLASASAFEANTYGRTPTGSAIRAVIEQTLRRARLEASQVGHVNAHGLSTVEHDRAEAQAIRDTLGAVPVTALKSYFGNLGAGSGGIEMAASVLALVAGEVPCTLNYERPDPQCRIEVIRDRAYRFEQPTALLLNQTTTGHAVAVAVAGPNG